MQVDTDSATSKLMATVRWTYRNDQTTVDMWNIHIRNLTREQNGYSYHEQEFHCEGGTFAHILVLFKLLSLKARICLIKPPPPYEVGHRRICFTSLCNICSIRWWIFSSPLSLVHLGTKMNWLGSMVKVTFSQRRRLALNPAVEWSFLVFKKLKSNL